MASRKLILHIGFPKTGSSAIQAWLAKNAAALADHGITYRNFKENATQDAITSGNARMLLDLFRATPQVFERASAEFERTFIPRHFEALNTAIISGEGLAGAPAPRLEWFKKFCCERQISVSVLGYCRTIYDHCYSEYQQFVKGGGETGTFREFAAEYGNPQCKYLWSWHSEFGDVMTVRIYDQVKNDLVRDFVHQTGIDNLALNTEQAIVNRSLTFNELELLRRLNSYHKGILSRRLSDALIYANPSTGPDYYFDSQIAEELVIRYGADVRRINEVVFPNASEQLLIVKPPDQLAANSWPPPQNLNPTVEIVLKALSESAAEMKEREPRLRGLLAMQMAKSAMASGKWESATQHLQRALQVSPKNASVERLLNEAYARLGDGEGAMAPSRNGRKWKMHADQSGGDVSPPTEYVAGIGDDGFDPDNQAIPITLTEVHAMSENTKGNAVRSEQGGAGKPSGSQKDDPKLAARREARDRMAYIRIRLQDITQERERLIAERTRLISERKEGQLDE